MFQFGPQLLAQLQRTVRAHILGPVRQPHPAVVRPRGLRAVKKSKAAVEASSPASEAVVRAVAFLKATQSQRGFFEGRVYDNVTMTAEWVFLLQFLGILTESMAAKCRDTILSSQLPDGGWNLYHTGPSDHSATVEAYFALKVCGLSRRHKALRKAQGLILSRGGIETTRVFTKIALALFGEYSWDRVPVINPELMLLPRQSPIHLYEFSSWSRAVIVPLLIIFDRKPIIRLPHSRGVGELWCPERPASAARRLRKLIRLKPAWDLEQIFRVGQSALSIYERSPVKPLRSKALDMAEKWIIEHQDPGGNWGGIFPAMANSLMALHLRGYPLNHPVMQKGLASLSSFGEESDRGFRMQSTVSPVWDTTIAMHAMQEAGLPPTDPSIRLASAWLRRLQILDKYGDWEHKALADTRPGGWPFEHENDRYPDIDDTALAVLALLPSEQSEGASASLAESVDRAVEWLLGMQGSDGGWGAFDRDNNRRILNQIPFADLKSLLDPGTPDVTGHVIEALGRSGFDRTSKPIERAVEFLRKTQEKDGSWFGRWGVNYVYGTAAAICGLNAVGENMKSRHISRACDFLLSTQNPDGGWGESCDSYRVGRYVPLGHSTASQTSWGVMGLSLCPAAPDKAIDAGVDWLTQNQKEDGSWQEPEWTGTGFPKHFYLRYDFYRLYFPVWALGLALRRRRERSA